MIDLKKIEYIKQSKSPFKIFDIVIFGLVIVLTVVLTLSVFGSKGENVLVTINGESKVYKLSRDAQIQVEGKMKIIIERGECYVVDSSCNNKTCEHMGKIKYVNQSIVCAQNNIVIKIIGKSDLAGSVG